ncbi:hypothetical protein [Candidatus Magnetominusculus dajiuhuensis]|uniref:hypothetical protein n=1 Tax=Candidatus Magnetominusculus dajiuhuensis TaxID=3137712 RepID=UPI0019DF28E4|nr:hypothetical protein [Nitrospirota bacterium]
MMSGKLLLAFIIVLLAAASCFAAYETDSCHDLYDIYGGCFKQGKAIAKIKCKALADELWQHFLDKATTPKEEQISGAVADICEDGCLDAIEKGEPLSIHSFREQYCK